MASFMLALIGLKKFRSFQEPNRIDALQKQLLTESIILRHNKYPIPQLLNYFNRASKHKNKKKFAPTNSPVGW